MPQFLNPNLLWWLAAILPAITILYFLKLRRQDQVVSSTLLWRRSVYDLRVNAPMQMIKRNLLLLLQLIIATLIILALARPFTKLTHAQGRRAALIIDASGSMATRDEEGGRTRFEAAKERALALIDSLGEGLGATPNDELCVIMAADRPLVLCGLTADKNRLRQAVASLPKPRSTRTDMKAALEMAVAVTGVAQTVRELESGGEIAPARKPSDPEDDPQVGMTDKKQVIRANVIILSDGAFPKIPQRLADMLAGANAEAPPDELGVGSGSRFIPFGKLESDNLAIVSADTQVDPGGTSDRQLFVRVENMARQAQSTTIEVELNGQFLDRKELQIPGRSEMSAADSTTLQAPGQAGAVFEIPADAEGVLKIQLQSQDALDLDDTVFAVIRLPEPIRVLLVTTGNFFIEKALEVDAHNVAYDRLAPAQYPQTGAPKTAKGRPYEIIIFDGWAPPTVPPGASFFIDAVPELPGIREDQDRSPLWGLEIIDWNRTHPLMRNLTLLDTVTARKCRKLVLEKGWATVIDGEAWYLADEADLKDEAKVAAALREEAPVLGCLVTEERRVAVLAFNIFHCQEPFWPMRLSFPLFIKNTVHWLARPGGIARAMMYRTGDTLRLEYEQKVRAVKVRIPSGAVLPAQLSGSESRHAYFSATYEVGLYRVLAPPQKDRLLACNLLSSAESDNAARPEVMLGEDILKAERGPVKRNTDLWLFVILAALLFLLAEWYVYNRRILG